MTHCTLAQRLASFNQLSAKAHLANGEEKRILSLAVKELDEAIAREFREPCAQEGKDECEYCILRKRYKEKE